MQLKKLIVKDFQSLGNITFNFPSGLVLIDGYNEDLNSFNGVGKSALLNSIAYAIYGAIPKGVLLHTLIRDGATSMSTTIEFEANSHIIIIKRHRTIRGSHLDLIVDGVPITGMAKQLEDKILEYIGLTFEQFTQVVYIFQNSANRFVSLNDTEKKKFLSTVLNLGVYDEAYKLAHTEAGKKELEEADINGRWQSAEDGYKQAHIQLTQVTAKLNTLKAQHALKLAELSAQATILKMELDALESERLNCTGSPLLANLEQQKVDAMEQTKGLETAQETIKEAERDIKNCQNEIKRYKIQIEQLQSSKCPTCHQGWPSWDTKRVADVKTFEDTVVQTEANLVLKMGTRDSYIDLLKHVDAAVLKTNYEEILQKIAVEKTKGPQQYDMPIRLKKTELRSISNAITAQNEQVELVQSELARIQNSLGEYRVTIDTWKSRRNGVQLEKEELLDVKRVFSPLGVRAFVFTDLIQQLNDSISKYLNLLTNGLIKFELQVNGEKFIEVLEYAGQPRTVTSLSGGEFRRVSLAVDLALSDTISARMSVSPNILILDEAFEGLDITGREAVMTLLQELSSTKDTILVIDHSSEFKTSFSSTFKLTKKNGETYEDKEN